MEVDGGVQVAVIGQCHGGLAELGGALDHVGDMPVPVEQGVLGVVVQVDEVVGGHGAFHRDRQDCAG